VRPAAVFGPGENGNFSRLARALKAGLFLYPGKKDTIKACGYVNDLVRSLFFMSARSQGVTIYNYCYPQAYTIADITDAFIRVGDYRAFRATMPTAPLLAISALCEFANTIGIRNGINPARVLKLRRSTNIEPRALVESKFQFDTTLETALLQWQTEKSSYEFT
jgi:nucleoside-diphosphate-sugar epimerase